MDFNLVLCTIFAVLMVLIVPVICYLCCNKITLDKFRNLFLVFYIIILFIGTTADVVIENGIISVNYKFLKIWGNKEMFWGFDKITFLSAILNLIILIPLGEYIASSNKERKWWQTILFACFVGMLVSILIETMQFILPVDRVVEFSDTVLNTISCGLGALLIVIFKKPRKRIHEKPQQVEQTQPKTNKKIVKTTKTKKD